MNAKMQAEGSVELLNNAKGASQTSPDQKVRRETEASLLPLFFSLFLSLSSSPIFPSHPPPLWPLPSHLVLSSPISSSPSHLPLLIFLFSSYPHLPLIFLFSSFSSHLIGPFRSDASDQDQLRRLCEAP